MEEASTPDKSIITLDIKKDMGFLNHLAYLARSDAHHDLKKEFTYAMYDDNPKIKAAFDSGIPEPATKVYHESGALAASIISANGLIGANNFVDSIDGKNLKNVLDNVPDRTSDTSTATYATFNTGFPGTPIFTYRVVKFVIECTNNTPEMAAGACKEDFGKRFVTNTNLAEGKTDVALIIDFSQHHFIQKLIDGTNIDFNVHYLMTP